MKRGPRGPRGEDVREEERGGRLETFSLHRCRPVVTDSQDFELILYEILQLSIAVPCEYEPKEKIQMGFLGLVMFTLVKML